MIILYNCGHSKYIEGGIFRTEFHDYDCDDCEEKKRGIDVKTAYNCRYTQFGVVLYDKILTII